MRTIEINDFTGGVYEAASPSDYKENQWTEIKGFVLADEKVLKSQWPLQRVGNVNGFREIAGLTALDGHKFIIGIKTDGTVWYMTAPKSSQAYNVVNAMTWTQVPNINLGGNLSLPNDRMQILGEVTARYPDDNQTDYPLAPALLISQAITTDGGNIGYNLTDYNVVIIAEAYNKIGAFHYRKNVTYNVLRRSRSGNSASLELDAPHLFRKGDSITVSGVGGSYNGTFVISSISTAKNYTQIGYVNSGPDEAATSSAGSVTGSVGAIYPGYTPAMPSNITVTQVGGNVTVAWTNEASGSDAAIRGYNIYDGDGVFIATVTGYATSYTYAGTANGAIVQPYNNYGSTPLDAIGGITAPAPGIIPKANVAAHWGGQLILADIEYYKDPTVIEQNVPLTNRAATRVRNGIWFSNPNTIDTFDPLAVFTVGTPETTIRALTVLPQGLLVHTTNTNEGSGLYLLRGSSIGLVSEEEVVLNSTLELIRSNVSTYPRQDEVEANEGYINTGITSSHVVNWPATGTVVYMDEKGDIYHTNAQDVSQIDTYGPSNNGIYTVASPSLAVSGRYLFMRRGFTETYVMRDLGQTGAWTQLNIGEVTRCMIGYNNDLYFVNTAGYVHRMVLKPRGNVNNEWGRFDNMPLTLSIATRPIGDSNRFNKQYWHRAGVRCYGGNASLTSMRSHTASSLVSSPAYQNDTVTPITERFEKVYPVHGPSEEICVRFMFEGYVEVEAVTLYVHGGQQSRP